jgi:hypothetical protein
MEYTLASEPVPYAYVFPAIRKPAVSGCCPVLKTKTILTFVLLYNEFSRPVATDATRARVNQGYQHIVGTNNRQTLRAPATRIARSSPHCAHR